jgi:hypothetical protein
MKCLVPMARANAEAAERLTVAIAPLRLSTRQVAALWSGWQAGDAKARELILTRPALWLRVHRQAQSEAAEPRPDVELLIGDFEALAGIARRARKRLFQGLWKRLAPAEREEAGRCLQQARVDWTGLWARFEKESADARSEHASGNPQAA